MVRRFIIMALAGLLAGASWGLQAAPRYPANPVLTPTAVFVSESGVARIDRQTGETVWEALAGEQTFEPVLTETRLLVGTSAGLVALAPESGEVLWRRFEDGIVFSPVVDKQTAYVSSRDGRLRALDLTRGSLRWSRQFEGWIYPPALVEGMLVTGGQAATLWGLDPATGETRWERALDQELVYRPIAGDAMVFATTFAGELLALDPATGELRWGYRDDGVSTSPVAEDGSLYLGRLDGVLQILDQATGELRFRRKLGEGTLLPVHVGQRRLVVADSEQRVTVLERDTLEIVWQGRLPIRLPAGPWIEGGAVAVAGPGHRLATVVPEDAP